MARSWIPLRKSNGIRLQGAGPVGTYQLDRGSATPSIKTTAELDTAVKQADVIFLTGPVHHNNAPMQWYWPSI